MIRKFLTYILIVIFIFLLLSFYFPYKHSKRTSCGYGSYLGSFERYSELLHYNSFKDAVTDKVNYSILKDAMHEYNKKCKEYNETEDKLIDKFYIKAISESSY